MNAGFQPSTVGTLQLAWKQLDLYQLTWFYPPQLRADTLHRKLYNIIPWKLQVWKTTCFSFEMVPFQLTCLFSDLQFCLTIPSLKLTARPWKLMRGRRSGFLLGRPLFRGYVSLREGSCLMLFERKFPACTVPVYPWKWTCCTRKRGTYMSLFYCLFA